MRSLSLHRTFFVIWILLWILFNVRPLFKNNYLLQYSRLIFKDEEKRRSIVYGQDLLDYLNFVKSVIPDGSTVKIVGLMEGSVDLVRAYYYLYPIRKSDKPEYILAYHVPDFEPKCYKFHTLFRNTDAIYKLEKRI